MSTPANPASPADSPPTPRHLPPKGLKVVESTHMVMGPTCGMVLADLGADVVAWNFKPGTMAKYGLDHASFAPGHPRLIYASLKGFLPGPYEHRNDLDEVVQMMRRNPPQAGEHTWEVLGELGLSAGKIDALVRARAVG